MPPQLATNHIVNDECANVAMLDDVHELLRAGHIDEGMGALIPALQARRLE